MSRRPAHTTKSCPLNAGERATLDRDGFLVREGAFDAQECRAIAADCEELAACVVAVSHGKKHVVGSYTDENPVAHRVATAMVFIDDATRQNGCLEAAPGSHKEGVLPMRAVEGFGAREMDTDHFDHHRLVALEVSAGSVVFFGSFLVHRSLPNRSTFDRRALLYSYQPAGYPHEYELFQCRAAAKKSAAEAARLSDAAW